VSAQEVSGAAKVAGKSQGCAAEAWTDADAHYAIDKEYRSALPEDSAYDFTGVLEQFERESCDVTLSPNLLRISYCEFGLPATVFVSSRGQQLVIFAVCDPLDPDRIIRYSRCGHDLKIAVQYTKNVAPDSARDAEHFAVYPFTMNWLLKGDAAHRPRALVVEVSRNARELATLLECSKK
jgi:hypothetical protein